ncbi:MAG: hypothetical protein U1E69_14960 [Tabrizicola sp.]|uniref:hypothetical protein n=1 Tax=Tabrizicola sp. TaxID=2005166 RepID=UPI002ABA9FFE|nr:hypothetical protein [Tabrizicola sp.]MDZ4088088.1 hypothetical protein [Tabrizicola sp.]
MTAIQDQIEVAFSFADLPLPSLMKRVQAFHQPSRGWQILASVAAWLVLTIGFLGLFQLGNGYPAEGPEFAMVGFASGMVVTALLLMLMSRAMFKSTIAAITEAPSRQGQVRIVLGEDGLAFHGHGPSVVQTRENVSEVVAVQDVTLIMPSRSEFYPVPHANLPAGITPEILLERIALWRKQKLGAQ